MKLYKRNYRLLWVLSVIYPSVGMPAIYMHYLSNNTLWLLYPFIITYLITPFIDIFKGYSLGFHIYQLSVGKTFKFLKTISEVKAFR